MNMNNVEILTAARDLISDPKKWMKGDFCDIRRTCFCGLGAIAEVQGVFDPDSLNTLHISDVLESKAADYLRKAVLEINPHYEKGQTFAPFNDAPERTHSEVINAFNIAIEKAKEEQN